MPTISEVEFAKAIFKYTNLDDEEIEDYLDMVRERTQEEKVCYTPSKQRPVWFMYEYVFIYVCIYLYVFVFICIYLYCICIYLYVFMSYVWIYKLCMYVYVYMFMFICLCMYLCMSLLNFYSSKIWVQRVGVR